jgi:MFS family permease
MTIGVAAVFAGGWLADSFVRRGRVDGPLRVGIVASAGMLVFATTFPLMPNAVVAVASLAVVKVCAALRWGGATAAAAEIVPARMRAQGVALYFLVLNLISFTLGPSSVAWLTDYLFRDESSLRYSLAVVSALGEGFAIAFLVATLAAYRRTLASRDEPSTERRAPSAE